MAITDQILGLESGNDPNAVNPRSSATGVGQFLSGTWLDMIRKYRPDLASLPQNEILGLRTDPNLSKAMTDAYANQNSQYLAQKGLPVTPGTTYLAHFAGPSGAEKVLSADPTAPVSEILGPSVIQANPFLANMSAGDLRAWADKKMGMPIAGPPAPAMGAPQPPMQAQQQASLPPQPQPAQNSMAPLGMMQPQPSPYPAQTELAGPALNAPIQYAPRHFNIADALSRIPLPKNFKGFSYLRG